jgi:hypothetical protein
MSDPTTPSSPTADLLGRLDDLLAIWAELAEKGRWTKHEIDELIDSGLAAGALVEDAARALEGLGVDATPLLVWDMDRSPGHARLALLVVRRGLARARTAPAPPPPKPPRLKVDLACKTLTLDGTANDVPSVQALRWVKVLADHPGEWVSGPDLPTHDQDLDGVRTDRLKKHLPTEVLSLLDSEPGKGSRLRLA